MDDKKVKVLCGTCKSKDKCVIKKKVKGFEERFEMKLPVQECGSFVSKRNKK